MNKKHHYTGLTEAQVLESRKKYGRTIQTGPRGGQYYTNSRGNKVYVPKR